MAAKQDIDKFTRRLNAYFKKALSRDELTALGKIAIGIISVRTRGGFGVKRAGDNAARLKRLSPSYVDYRKKSKKLNKALTTPGRSNLTFTGVLLDSLRVVNVSATEQKLFINANKRRRRDGKTNEEVAEFVAENGRDFLNLSRREVEKIARSYRRNLVANLKKDFR